MQADADCAQRGYACGCHEFKQADPEVIERHEREVLRRLKWCIENGHVPAHEHLHLAPGDDTQFVYGVPPWTSDGKPNPMGIYYTPECPVMRKLGSEQNNAQGWTCTQCKVWVEHAPRSYHGGEEPWNWWFCMECKAKAVKPSAKLVAREKEARQCVKITTYMSSR